MTKTHVCSLAELLLEGVNSTEETKIKKERREGLLKVLQGLKSKQSDVEELGYLRKFYDLTRREGHSTHKANKIIVDEALDNLQAGSKAAQNRAAILIEHYYKGLPLKELSKKYVIGDPKGDPNAADLKLNRARESLLKEIHKLERVSRRKHRNKQYERLERATDKELVGPSTTRDRLKEYLLKAGSPFLIALKGIGGIGKTTQVSYILHELIEGDHFDQIIWISARQEKITTSGRLHELGQPELTLETLTEDLLRQLLPKRSEPLSQERAFLMLEEHLNRYPSLIFIDNIETAPDVVSLLPELERLVNPSKIIFTTRVELESYDLPIAHIDVPELSESNALLLIRETAYARGLENVMGMGDEHLAKIYRLVKGNPLALELLTGPIDDYGVEPVIEAIQEGSNGASEELFAYIYAHDWRDLRPPASTVLSVMPLLHPRGGEYALLAAITKPTLSTGKLQSGLKELIRLSLVQTYRSGGDVRYRVHGLTLTFLGQELQRKNLTPTTTPNVFADFDEHVIRALEFAYAETTAAASVLPDYEREQFLHILEYGLDLSLGDEPHRQDIWSATRQLLMALTAKFEITGFHETWIKDFVRRGIHASQENDDLHHEALLQTHLGRLYRRRGQYEDAHEVLAASIAHFETANDTDNLIAAIVQQAHIYALQRHHEAAKPLIQQAIKLLSVTDPRLEYVYFIEGLLALNNNDGKAAEEAFGKSLKLCEAQGDQRWIATRLGNLATALYIQKKLEQALAYYERSKNLFDEIKDHVQKAMMLLGIACVYVDQDRSEKALEAFAEAEPILRNAHEVLHIGMLYLNSAIALKWLERWQEAEERFVHALTWYSILNDYYRCANANLELGMMYEEQGYKKRAKRAYKDGLDNLNHCEPGPSRDALTQKLQTHIESL